ncbi:MAG: hypothetical protein AAGJ28_19045 [Pseudomonadota bacterium]
MASLDYVLTLGVVLAAFMGLAMLLFRALQAATEIESVIFSLPVG